MHACDSGGQVGIIEEQAASTVGLYIYIYASYWEFKMSRACITCQVLALKIEDLLSEPDRSYILSIIKEQKHLTISHNLT